MQYVWKKRKMSRRKKSLKINMLYYVGRKCGKYVKPETPKMWNHVIIHIWCPCDFSITVIQTNSLEKDFHSTSGKKVYFFHFIFRQHLSEPLAQLSEDRLFTPARQNQSLLTLAELPIWVSVCTHFVSLFLKV